MDSGIGPTLREARSRRKLDLPEVEAAIKIRVRYLRALENEDWDVLPGGAYTRGFIRTYASYLGLDGERLAEDYRRSTAPPGGEKAPSRVEPAATGTAPRRRARVSSRAWAAIVSLGLVGALIAVGLASGGGDDSGPERQAQPGQRTRSQTVDSGAAGAPAAPRARPGVAVQLTATAEVWVCLLDADERPLIEGQILEAGAEAGPYRSAGFRMAFGNGGVTVLVDGEEAEIPASSSPIGYEIGAEGELAPLEEGERPTCT